jgi:hypothetical protein
VRRYVASILALFIVTIACSDPLCCSDGCDRGGVTATHSTQTGADCPICLSAVISHHDAAIARTDFVTQMREPIEAGPISPFRTDVDHPPRPA